jgi:hypothetical protein
MDELHELPEGFERAYRKFRRDGCAVFETSHGTVNPELAELAEVAGILMDLLGDDVDGVAAELEDFEAMLRS